MTAYAIKVEIVEPSSLSFEFVAQKTMYGGKKIAAGDAIFLFASENEGGEGLVAKSRVTSSSPVAREPGIERQTPRVSITVERLATARHRLGRKELKPFADWDDGRAETELNLKFYRQATDKIVGLSDRAAGYLEGLF
ncbi:MAG: hypothetical protein ABL866_13660 [Devosia sp.]